MRKQRAVKSSPRSPGSEPDKSDALNEPHEDSKARARSNRFDKYGLLAAATAGMAPSVAQIAQSESLKQPIPAWLTIGGMAVATLAGAAVSLQFLRKNATTNEQKWRAQANRLATRLNLYRKQRAIVEQIPVAPSKAGQTFGELVCAQLHPYYSRARSRLEREVDDLRLRNQLNLIIGGGTTMFAALTLTWLAWDARGAPALALPAFASTYLPRIALAITIELFSFFFLRLYRAGLADVKFFQNELTNLESRFAGFEAALMLTEGDKTTTAVATTITAFVNTERNFVIKPGESTIDIERQKSDGDTVKQALVAFTVALAKAKGS